MQSYALALRALFSVIVSGAPAIKNARDKQDSIFGRHHL